MIAEVMAVGDELVSGQRLDTNSQWLSQRLGELGIPVVYHTTVGDDLQAHARVLREAFDRADVVLSTGGLGPTADDLTRQALATATDTHLETDSASLAHIRALFARRKREMPERNAVQAMFPVGSRAIANEHGTAPGIEMSIARKDRIPCRFFGLPGVPAEMRAMWVDGVSPTLLAAHPGPRHVIMHKCVRCFGVGESDLERMLPDMIRRGRTPSVGITASRSTITLRITARAESEAACHLQMAPSLETIHNCLGVLVYGYDDDELQDVVVRLLRKHQRTLATVEVTAGGKLANWLSEADPSRETYVGGVVTRMVPEEPVAARASKRVAGLEHDLEMSGTDADAVAKRAERVRGLLQSDYGLALGPFPHSDSAEVDAGDLVVGIASAEGTFTKTFPFAGHPQMVRDRAAKHALNLLRLQLLKRE
jgi:nicotinamide-nucleotide amidase